MRVLPIALVFLLVAVGTTRAGTPQEPNFTETRYVTSTALNDATGLAWAPDGTNRLFVALKGGSIRIIENGTLLAAAFATETLYTSSECGLVGICFDRDFANNPYLYAFATVSGTQQQILRYDARTNTAAGRTVILSGLPTRGQNHDGGGIDMGPDQRIYFTIGDLGNGTGVDLDTTTLASKVGCCLRDGSAPTDNPFYNAGDGITATDYIWARGFRNPFTLTVHPVTGRLWVNVVGTSWEQVFLVQRGDHAGWDNYEGGNQPAAAPYIQPKVAYRTNVSAFGGCITGGAFYSGTQFPATHRNNFFFGDYNSSKIMRCVLDGTHTTVTATTEFVTAASQVVDVAVGPDGALYYVGRGGGGVYRIAYTAATPQNIIVSPSTLTVGEGSSGTFTVRLAAQPSADVTVSVTRSSGDSDVSALPASITFTTTNWDQLRTVTVNAAEDADTVNDAATISCSSAGLTTQNVTVTVTDNDVPNGAPTAAIVAPLSGATVSGSTAEFYGNGTDDNGTVRAEFYVDGVLSYTDVNTTGHYHYGGVHNAWNTTGLSSGSHTLRMVVYDAQGLSGAHQIVVTVSNSTSAASSGSGRSKKGCGCTGFEAALLVLALLRRRTAGS